MNDGVDGNELNRIEKRAIEALAIAPMIRELSQRIGWDEALATLRGVNEREAFHRGQCAADPEAPNGIEEMVDEVASWGEGGVWEIDVLEKTPKTYFFNVTRCPYYDKYKELGLVELGVAMSCCRDEPHARGFNPNLRLERTKTIMEGDDYCDFRYHLSSDSS